MLEFIKEMFEFLHAHKKLWLIPVFIILILFGGLMVMAKGTIVAPFIYTLF